MAPITFLSFAKHDFSIFLVEFGDCNGELDHLLHQLQKACQSRVLGFYNHDEVGNTRKVEFTTAKDYWTNYITLDLRSLSFSTMEEALCLLLSFFCRWLSEVAHACFEDQLSMNFIIQECMETLGLRPMSSSHTDSSPVFISCWASELWNAFDERTRQHFTNYLKSRYISPLIQRPSICNGLHEQLCFLERITFDNLSQASSFISAILYLSRLDSDKFDCVEFFRETSADLMVNSCNCSFAYKF